MPGNPDVERRIKSLVRWNAAAMVVRANKASEGIGGHISTFASAATLYEVAFNHFFRGHESDDADVIFFQGHAAPGVYARAYLEGRLDESHLENFRRELSDSGGLSSYPHPWLMPDFWEYPTVSMGLGPLMAIYQARFTRYLEDRGLKPKSDAKRVGVLGDGESDEPGSARRDYAAGAREAPTTSFSSSTATCSGSTARSAARTDHPGSSRPRRRRGLERHQGPVGPRMDALLAKDRDGLLVKRMGEIVDGQYQKHAVDRAPNREHFWGVDPRLLDMVKHLSDDQLKKMRARRARSDQGSTTPTRPPSSTGSPPSSPARSRLRPGEAGEGKNITHQQKKMNDEELRAFRTRFGIPVSDAEIAHAPFYRPAEDSVEVRYLKERRQSLGGFVPTRKTRSQPLQPVPGELFEEFHKGTDGRKASTTMVAVRVLSKLLRDKDVGRLIVPIVPDEARTFGMEGAVPSGGHLLTSASCANPWIWTRPVLGGVRWPDLEEGYRGGLDVVVHRRRHGAVTHASTRSRSSSTIRCWHQRIGDLIRAAGDSRARGPARRNGRPHDAGGGGLQHQDGTPAVRAGVSQLRGLRPGLCLRSLSSSRTASGVCRTGEHLLPDGHERSMRCWSRPTDATDPERANASGRRPLRWRAARQLFAAAPSCPVVKAQILGRPTTSRRV